MYISIAFSRDYGTLSYGCTQHLVCSVVRLSRSFSRKATTILPLHLFQTDIALFTYTIAVSYLRLIARLFASVPIANCPIFHLCRIFYL